jgi:hypothetical protein
MADMKPINEGHQAQPGFDPSAAEGMPGQILAYEIFYDLAECVRYVKTLYGSRANPLCRVAGFSVVAPTEPFYMTDEQFTREKRRLAEAGHLAVLKHPATDSAGKAEDKLAFLMRDAVAKGLYGPRIIMPASLAEHFSTEGFL